MIRDIHCPFCGRFHTFEEGVNKLTFYCSAVELQISLDIFSPRRQEEWQEGKGKEWNTDPPASPQG